MFRHPLWSRLISCTPDAPGFISLITAIFSDKGEIAVVQNLSGANAQAVIDRLDEVGLSELVYPKRTTTTLIQNPTLPKALDLPKLELKLLEKVSEHSVQDVWPPGITSKVTPNPTLLQSIRLPKVPGVGMQMCGWGNIKAYRLR
jgi:hypothetical protein